MDQEQALELDSLRDSYDIIGELTARADARTFMASRRDDGRQVLIVVSRPPARDEGNALSHLAADVGQLTSLSHPNIVPVLECRWVGTDALAVVMDRPRAPALDELLTRREEEFNFARIGNILREANEVMNWARERKIVHRNVLPETLFIEPGSDKVFASFAVRPLPMGGVPGEEADARCIAVLARTMLTRSPADPERDELPLAELRPGLPAVVVETTEQLLSAKPSTRLPDVRAYIAQLAMADYLKRGEEHLAHTRAAMEEQQRQHTTQLEQERRAHEQQIAAERKAHDEAMATARADHERAVSEQAKKFEKERQDFERQLAKERKTLEKEREALARERAAHERDCARFAAEREQHDREVREAREQLEWDRAALTTQAEVSAQAAVAQTPVEATPVVPPKPRPAAPKPSARPSGPPWWMRAWNKRPRFNRSWAMPAAAIALVLLIGITALALSGGHRRGSPRATASNSAPTVRLVDSAGGLSTLQPDSTAIDTTIAAQEAPPVQRRSYFARPERTEPERIEPEQPVRQTADSVNRVARPAADSIVRDTVTSSSFVFPPILPRTFARDSLARRDSLTRPRTDTIRRDSLRPPPDTLPTSR